MFWIEDFAKWHRNSSAPVSNKFQIMSKIGLIDLMIGAITAIFQIHLSI
jgi:hypothetical protein